MVNYHDPHTIARDASAYAFPSDSGACGPIMRLFFSTAAGENLHHVFIGLFMWVYLPCRARLHWQAHLITQRDISHLAGNFSLPLTMSGMSFEGVAHTDGQYGSVTFSVFVTTDLQQKINFTCYRSTPSHAWPFFWARLSRWLASILQSESTVRWVPVPRLARYTVRSTAMPRPGALWAL
jgi:hypothetical protein